MAKHARAGLADTAAERLADEGHRPAGPPVPARHAAAARLTGPRLVGIAAAVVVCLAVGVFMIVSGVNLSSADPAAAPPAVTPTNEQAAATTAASRGPAMTAQLAVAAAPSATDPSATDQSAAVTAADPPPIPLPATGPGITGPGILLFAWPAPDGSLEVIERVRTAGTVGDVTLRPASVDRAGQQFASVSAAATQVQLNAGGKEIAVPNAEIGATTTLAVGQVDRFDLRYRLPGVAVLSTPSTSGRALAALAPLTGGMNQDLPVLIVAAGDSVLSLSCPLLQLSEQACGSRVDDGPGFRRELPSRLALTTVQFNVPSA